MINSIINDVNSSLKDSLFYLKNTFGICERIVKGSANKKNYYPVVYDSYNNYKLLTPSIDLGCFSFWDSHDAIEVVHKDGEQSDIDRNLSLIVWLDVRRVFNSETIRDKEAIRDSILKALNRDLFIRNGSLRVVRIWDRAENIYRGYSLDELDNQFLMHPYLGFRFECKIKYSEIC